MRKKSTLLAMISPIIFCTVIGSSAGGKPSATSSHPPADSSAWLGYYIGAHGGVAFPDKTPHILQDGYVAGGQVGYRDDNYRAELALGTIQHNFVRGPNSQSRYGLINFTLNLFYDFNYTGTIIPFLGLGAGYLHAGLNQCPTANAACSSVGVGSHFIYQGIAGIGLGNAHVRFNLRYRYLGFTSNRGFYENIAEIVVNYFFSG